MSAIETGFAIATGDALLILRPGSPARVEAHLRGKAVECVVADPQNPEYMLAGTWGFGLWRSVNGGADWELAADGVPQKNITAVAIASRAGDEPPLYYAGTAPSELVRSHDRGLQWETLDAMLALPSSESWSFPPQPHTHHVRWIETDPHRTGTIYVAIEAGALIRSFDGGDSWHDRVEGGPFDTHSAARHPRVDGRLLSAAGDGFFESDDGGETWSRPMDGLNHRYLVGVASDPADSQIVLVSAAAGPYVAYQPRTAEAYLYRRQAESPFVLAMDGLPEAVGTVASRLATTAEPGVFYAANNHGVFKSIDSGQRWEPVSIDWPEGAFRHGVRDLAVIPA